MRQILILPADHSWLVVSDVNFDSTLVGGSAKLIEAIIQTPKLETMRGPATDSLTAVPRLVPRISGQRA